MKPMVKKLLIFGGVVGAGYWLYRRSQGAPMTSTSPPLPTKFSTAQAPSGAAPSASILPSVVAFNRNYTTGTFGSLGNGTW